MNYISPSNHPESPLSGSTVESMIDRSKKLGLGYFAVTDLGNLSSIVRAYTYGDKKDVKIIPGIEIVFKDSDCPIIEDTESAQIKYFKFIIHAQDQVAFQKIVKMSSDQSRRSVQVGEGEYKTFNWKDLEELSKFNITVTNSNVEDLITKHLLVDRADIAYKYYKKVKDMFGDKYYPSIIPYQYDKYWQSMVEVTLGDDNKIVHISANDRIETDHYQKALAKELPRRGNRHKLLKSVYINKIRYPVKYHLQEIKKARLLNEFQPLPGGDVQTKANKFILAVAKREGDLDRVLINNYSYYADEGDQVVQSMKLGEERRINQKQHMKSIDEAKEYLHKVLELDDSEVSSLVSNSHKWAKGFDDFSLKYNYRLPNAGSDPKGQLLKVIEEVGRMDWNNPVYVKQYEEELSLLNENGVIDLIPYFLPIVDVYKSYKDNGYLTGPARGSAGGFLISYLIGITHIDPIKYDLSSSRFLTIDRVEQGNLPDIDCDLESRLHLVGKDGNGGFLFNKYGSHAAQVSTRTLLRIKSAILDANRFVNKGKLEQEIQALSKSLPTTPQGVSDQDFVFGYDNGDGSHEPGLLEQNEDLQKYAVDRPEEWDIVKRALSISRQNSRHACFAAGTLVDSNGKVDFIDLAPNFSDNKPITTWYSGVKNTVIVSMNNGVSIQCTPDHRFIVGNKEIEAKDLKGEFVSYKPFKNVSGNEIIDSDMAFSLGWFLNDGAYIKSKNGDERFEFYFTPEKDNTPKERVLAWLNKNNYKVTPAKDREDTYRAYGLPSEFKIEQNTYNKRIPKEFWKWDLRPQRNFMSGLFSANGYCLNTRPTVAIKLTSKLLVSDIAIWLNSKGINTSCSYSKPVTINHSNGTYISRPTATLNIPHFTNKIAFENLVGFVQEYKSDRLRQIIEDAKNTNYTPNKVKCLDIEESDKVPVWDFNEPLENVGYINGVLVHNCAYVVSDRPIEEDVPIFEVGGVKRVTQYEHKHCEWAGLIKYDFLVVDAVKKARVCLDYINKKNGDLDIETGYFVENGKKTFVWDLPVDQKVFKMLWRGETETVFQLNSKTATPLVMDIKPESIVDCAVITSLGRPGPLDFKDEDTGRNMAEEYGYRKRGQSISKLKIMDEMLPETYGVLVFQEQVTKLAKELAGMNVIDAENVRIAVGKKKKKLIDSLKPIFIEGASKKIPKSEAEQVWDMMETFARYGFNKSHAVAYSVISYACAYFKYHYPLEWWAAVISTSDTKKINEEYYQYIKDMVLPPDINISTEEISIDYNEQKIRSKLSMISGLGKKVADKIMDGRPYTNLQDFIAKKVCGPALTRKLIHVGVLNSFFDSGTDLMTKMQVYENTVKKVEFTSKLNGYQDKILATEDEKSREKAVKNMERYIEKGPKPGKIEPVYMMISPKKDYLMKKDVFPTMNLDLNKVLKKESSTTLLPGHPYDRVMDAWGREVPLVSGEHLQRIDEMDLKDDQEVVLACPAYVIEAEEFTFHETKKALKLILDSSGYISEKVLWANYETGILDYPKSLKKGAIVYVFYKRKLSNSKGICYTNITNIIVEQEPIK